MRFLTRFIVCSAVMMAAQTAQAAPYLHDGFQLRASLGAGAMYLSAPGNDTTISGVAGGFDLYVGGSLIPGLAIGVVFGGGSALGPAVNSPGGSGALSTDISLNLTDVGAYLNYYPDPLTGFHLVAEVGFAWINYKYRDTVISDTPRGFAVAVGVGYDFWLAREWSFGPLLKVSYAATTYDDGSGDHYVQNTLLPILAIAFNFQ